MDANGRVLLPISIRYRLDLNDGDKFADRSAWRRHHNPKKGKKKDGFPNMGE
jgi:hypothetical protein